MGEEIALASGSPIDLGNPAVASGGKTRRGTIFVTIAQSIEHRKAGCWPTRLASTARGSARGVGRRFLEPQQSLQEIFQDAFDLVISVEQLSLDFLMIALPVSA